MKLYDRAMAQLMSRASEAPSLVPNMQAAAIIDVSNVAAYCNVHGFDPHTVPSYRPPFDVTWFETSKPYVGDPLWNDPVYEQVGALAICREMRPVAGTGTPEGNWLAVGWYVFVREGNRVALHPSMAEWMQDMMQLDEHGQWDGHSESGHAYWHDEPQSAAVRALAPFLMAIGFLHCKNVELVEGQQVEGALRKKQEKKLGRPLTTFKELVIDPSMTQKRYTETNGRPRQRGTRSLHIARGHFATYSEDRPLFGKYSGTFWKPAHVRGSADIGTVAKDYAVKAPKT